MSTGRLAAGIRVRAIVAVLLVAVTVAPAYAQDGEMASLWLPDNSRSQRLPSPLPLTADGRDMLSAWEAGRDPLEDDPGRYCQSPGMPSIVLSGAGYPMEVVATGEQVLILFEAHQQVRRVFLDAAHPDKPLPQRNGHSIGHWEGDTLVVDTTAIRPIVFGAVPHSDQVHVVERIRVTGEGDTLVNTVTITDPVFYTRPIVVERFFTAAPQGTMMLEYECTEAMWIEHEESRGLPPFTPQGP